MRLDVCPFCGKVCPKIAKASDSVTERRTPKILDDLFEPSADVIKEFVDVRDQVQLLYNLVYGFLSKNNEPIKAKRLSSGELCDFGYICRELENVFDELRKEVKARKELCGQIIAYQLITASVADPTTKLKVQGQFASGTPDVKMQMELPKKFTEEYYKITDHFGIPRKIAETGILRLDWKAVTEHCTKLLQDGKQIPQGFGKKYPKYATVYRKRSKK